VLDFVFQQTNKSSWNNPSGSKSIPNQHILWITEMCHWFGKGQASQPLSEPQRHTQFILFQPLCKKLGVLSHFACSSPLRSIQSLLGWNNLYCIPTLQTLPSYGRKPALFGHIVSDFREAWQRVSTISRSKLTQHKHSPITTKTIQTCKEQIHHLPITFLSKKNEVLTKLFYPHLFTTQ
jgi:hypothetical protein